MWQEHGSVDDVGFAIWNVLWKTQPLTIRDQEIAHYLENMVFFHWQIQ